MKIYKQPTLADSICDLRTRKIKTTFFTQINTIIDWNAISKIIDGIKSILIINIFIILCFYV